MAIDFNPDAARRFDELALELLTDLRPQPSAETAQTTFRPDVYPVAQISEQEVIGEIRQIQSVVDGTQEEVGRFFKHGQSSVALVGPGFKKLAELAMRIQNTEGLTGTTSIDFVRNAIFEWIEQRYKNAITDSCMQYVVKRAEEAVKDHEIWIPLHQTYLESPFSIGPVAFRTITASMLAKSFARFEEQIPKESEETNVQVRLALARERSKLQSCAAAVVKICAEENKAVAVAREQSERAVALLRFFSPSNWTPKLRSFCTLLGSENIRQSAELFVDGESILLSRRGVLDRGQAAWVLSREFMAQFPGLLQGLSSLAAGSARTRFRQSVYDALLMYSRNSVASDPADKLVYILVAVESLLLRNENEPIGKNIGERMAFLIGDTLETRKGVLANATEAYRLRSSFIHHGNTIQDLETLSTFMLNAWTCFYNLIMGIDRYQTKDDLIRALEDRKMS